MTKKKKIGYALLLIILIGLLVYFNSLNNGFVYDDQLVVKSNPFLTSLGNLKYFFRKEYFSGSGEYSYRPVLTLTYLLDYHFWKFNPSGYHLTNVVIHILTGILLYFFLLYLIPLLDKRYPSYPIALLTSLFFLLHPIQTSVVNGIAFREETLFCLLIFASLIFYLKSKFLFSFLFYFLALLTKETAIFLPLFILLIDLCRQKQTKGKGFLSFWHTKLFPYLGYLIVSGVYLYIHIFWAIPNMAYAQAGLKFAKGALLYHNLLTTSRIFISYLGLLFFPLRLSEEYIVELSSSIFEPKVLFSLFILTSIFILIIYNFRRQRILAFSGLWFFISLLPVTNIKLLSHLMAERYLYLTCVGFSLFLSAVLVESFYLKSQFIKKAAIFSVLLLLSFYSWRTITRNMVWRSDLVFWEERIKHPPVTERAYSSLGDAYAERDLIDKAIEAYKKALEVNPKYADAYKNLANLYTRKGLFDKAEEYTKKAIELKPVDYRFYNTLGNAYFKKGLYDKAEQHYKKALEMNPFYAEAHNNLGNLYAKKGLYDKAIEEFEKTLKMNPSFAEAYNNLGVVYFGKGIYDKALEQCEKAIELDPKYADAHNNLGRIYFAKGFFDKAIEQFKKAIEIDPGLFYAYYNLALISSKDGLYDKAEELYKKTLEINPNYIEAVYNLGNIYSDKRLYDQAAEQYKKALELNPNLAEAYHNLGVIYSQKGFYDEAIEMYKKTLALNPNFVLAYYNLGNIYFQKGFLAEAQSYYQKALELDPNFSPARDSLEQLRKRY